MLKHRVITGTSIALIALSVLFFLPAWAHLILLFAIFALAQMEFSGMVNRSGHIYELLPTTVCGVAYLVLSAAESPVFYSRYPIVASLGRQNISGVILSLTPAILLMRGVFRRRTDHAMETFALSYAGFWYVSVLLSFLVRIAFEWKTYGAGATNYTGRLALVLFIAIVKFSDIGAYTIGMWKGRRRLIPEISPKKSVEGLWGGYLFAEIISLVFWAFAQRYGNGNLCQMSYPLIHALILPILLTTTGVLGDLSESLIKRSVEVKDSGGRFPGMGGILDILDSLLFSAPIMYLYILAFLK